MWIALTFSAIALTGIEFMIWFLVGLLRERARSIYHWVTPVHRRSKRDRHQVVLSRIYCEQDCSAAKGEHTDYNAKLLENEGHAKKNVSDLILLHILPASGELGRRPIHGRQIYTLREPSL